ncbi:MAG: hypothetical protein QOG20_2204, partial [Pseudonocardiales bacterium]|nr:hypothetical protein [Pseudonocardiales bacterium]
MKARWRYGLEPADGETRITETFDYGNAPSAQPPAGPGLREVAPAAITRGGSRPGS